VTSSTRRAAGASCTRQQRLERRCHGHLAVGVMRQLRSAEQAPRAMSHHARVRLLLVCTLMSVVLVILLLRGLPTIIVTLLYFSFIDRSLIRVLCAHGMQSFGDCIFGWCCFCPWCCCYSQWSRTWSCGLLWWLNFLLNTIWTDNTTASRICEMSSHIRGFTAQYLLVEHAPQEASCHYWSHA